MNMEFYGIGEIGAVHPLGSERQEMEALVDPGLADIPDTQRPIGGAVRETWVAKAAVGERRQSDLQRGHLAVFVDQRRRIRVKVNEVATWALLDIGEALAVLAHRRVVAKRLGLAREM